MTRKKTVEPRIGAHKSIAKSIDLAIDRGLHSTCECLQIFTRPPRRWATGKRSLTPKTIQNFIRKSEAANYYDTAIHMPYLPNLATPDKKLFTKSVEVLIEEVKKASILHTPYVVTHVGSPKNQDEIFAAKRISEALDYTINHVQNTTVILLENSTARRKTWGNKIEHFESILSQIDEAQQQQIGICFDTAHAYSSGYDISSPEGLNEVFDVIDDIIGKEKVKMIHINDSKGALGSGIDHHEHIGQGQIGLRCFQELMQNPRFKNLSMILETPKDHKTSDKHNIDLLRKLRSNNSS
ncbi:MAG: deoxyribonuclease IV [Candidatus Hodarchaeales archaeon]|jgi:deoxyribonuclease-4